MASVAPDRFGARSPSGPPAVSLTLAPLGIPLAVELVGSDDLAMLAAVCRRWCGVASGSVPALRLHIEAAGEPDDDGAIRIVVEDRVMQLRGGGVAGTADPASGQAVCRVPMRYLASPDRLRSEVLEPLVLYLLGRHGRAPVHASCFVAGDLAVLLAGPSGSGKSCLALAADTAGFAVLSEDVVYVQVDPQVRVWGWPGPVHLLPANAPLGSFPQRVRNGKTKLAVPLRTAGSTATSASRAAFCLLERGDAVRLDRLAPVEALRRLGRLEPGFDVMAAEVRAAHAALAGNGAWRLTLSSEPGEAIRFVTANLARLGAVAVP